MILSRTNLAPPELLMGIPIFLITVSFATVLLGIMLDNFNTRKLVLIFTILGFLGLLVIPYSPILFGVLFGFGVALDRSGTYSVMMKLMKERFSWSVVPMSISRSLSTVVLPLFLAGFLKGLGWNNSIAILASIYLVLGLWVYGSMPNDYIQGWSLSVIRGWLKQRKMLFILSFMAINGLNGYIFSMMVPSLIGSGFTQKEALYFISGTAMIGVPMRFAWAYIGDKWNMHENIGIITGLCMIVIFFTIKTMPLTMIPFHFITNSAYSIVWWSYCRRAVGAEHVATLHGIAVTFAALLSALLFQHFGV